MKMKNSLTQKEIVLMKTVRDEYLNIFNSLEFDEAKCRKLINKLYSISKLKKPLIIILDSPLGVQYACNILKQNVGNQVWSQVRDKVDNQVRDKVENQVDNKVWSQVRDKVENQVDNKVWSQVRDKVDNQVYNQVRNQVRDNVDNQVYNQVRNQVMNQVWSQVWSQVGNQVENQVGNQVNTEKIEYFNFSYYGDCSDLSWISYYDYFQRIGIVKHKLFSQLKLLFKSSIFMSVQLKDVCFVSKPPIFLNRNDRNDMHCENDYAVYFKDGYGLYYLNGVYFSENDFNKYIKGKKATGKQIMIIKNAEQKASLIKLYGYEKLLNDLPKLKMLDKKNVKAIDGQQKSHILYSFEINYIKCCMMCLDDHSTNKKYFLGVPNTMIKINDALAWSFQMEKGSYYKPILQS